MKTKNKKIKGNLLIAEFMGGKFTLIKSHTPNVNFKKHPRQDRNFNNNDIHPKFLSYHKSWDWLMPVIKKIESMGFYVSIMKSNITCCKDGGISPVFEEYDYKDKLETTWLAVTAFIKWYNKQ